MAIDRKVFRARQRHIKTARLVVLVVLLATATTLGCLHQLNLKTRPVGVDALCPFGGIESAYTLIVKGALAQRVAWSTVVSAKPWLLPRSFEA